MFRFFRKKKTKKERELTPEQKQQLKEVKKWEIILQNVINYDGTERGQIHFDKD